MMSLHSDLYRSRWTCSIYCVCRLSSVYEGLYLLICMSKSSPCALIYWLDGRQWTQDNSGLWWELNLWNECKHSVQNQQQGCLHVCRNCKGNFHNHVVFLQASFDLCWSPEMLSGLKSFCKNQVKDDESAVDDESPRCRRTVIKTTERFPTRMICLFLSGWLWEENEDESEFAL